MPRPKLGHPGLDDPGAAAAAAGSSLGHDAWLRLKKNRLAMLSGLFLAAVFTACFLLVWLLRFKGVDANTTHLENTFAPPGATHWLGTDHQGRDLLARLLYGGQISLLVGLIATAVSLAIGIAYGAFAGYSGPRTDAIMMRVVDVLYAIPFLVIVIILKVVLGDAFDAFAHWLISALDLRGGWRDSVNRAISLLPLIFAIGLLGWLTIARITRAQVLALKEQEFVDAARSLGLSKTRILFRHIIPNTLGVAVIYATLTVPSFILFEASLSYLGMGVEASTHASWGILIKEGANFLESHPRLLIVPSLLFAATLFSLNFLGDGIRDALDPRSSKD